MKPKKGAKKTVGSQKKMAKVKKAEEFAFQASLYRNKKRVGRMQLESEEVLKWLSDRMKLATSKDSLEEVMKRILETSLHDDSDAGMPSHKAWQYCELFKDLWGWLKRIATEADNPNVRRHAGRALGDVIHELSTRKGKDWIEAVKSKNDAFEDKLVPFPMRRGGKPPNNDFIRWVNSRIGYHDQLWLEAMETAERFERGKHATLEDAWSAWRERHTSPSSALLKMMEGHPFAKQKLEVLRDFQALWKACLETLLKEEWEAERKAGKLRVTGDQNFRKRFGTLKDREAGLHLTKRHFDKYWLPAWTRHLENEEATRAALRRDMEAHLAKHPDATDDELSAEMLRLFLDDGE